MAPDRAVQPLVDADAPSLYLTPAGPTRIQKENPTCRHCCRACRPTPVTLTRGRTPSTPGHELAGVVTALGRGTTGLSVGCRVRAA
jgi:hypothetical protein